jgi:type IV pilus assembly protein PilM
MVLAMVKKINDSKYTQVGMDIGNFSIKVVGIKKQPLSNKRILSFGIEYIPKDAPLEQKAELIRKSLEDAGITTNTVNISVSGPNVICRYIRLPVMRKYELAKSLELEWDNYISLKIDEVFWDYVLLDKFVDSAGHRYIQVLLVAAKKIFIEERMRLLRTADLEAQLIDVDAFSLINAFKFTQPLENNQPIILLNIGEYFTNVAILRKGVCWFSRDISIGGRDITQIIVEKLHLSWPEAEKLKCSLDSKSAKAFQLIRTVLDNLVNELNLSFEYLKRELEEQIKFVYLSGGSVHLFQLDEFLSQNLNIPIRKWNPTQAFKLSPGLSQKVLEKHAPDLAVAIGLALAKRTSL